MNKTPTEKKDKETNREPIGLPQATIIAAVIAAVGALGTGVVGTLLSKQPLSISNVVENGEKIFGGQFNITVNNAPPISSTPTPDPIPIPTSVPTVESLPNTEVAVSNLQPVSLDLNEAPIRNALETLFKSAKVDYSIGPGVSGFVTLKITEQPFENALRLILRNSSTPLTYTKESGVYIVKSADPIP